MYIPHLKPLHHLIPKIYPLRFFFFMKKGPKIHIVVCKILIDGVMVVKLGKIVYIFTQHIHTTFEISTSFISLNIPPFKCFFYTKNVENSHYSGL